MGHRLGKIAIISNSKDIPFSHAICFNKYIINKNYSNHRVQIPKYNLSHESQRLEANIFPPFLGVDVSFMVYNFDSLV